MPVSPSLPRVWKRPPELAAFGKRLKQARSARGLSQTRLAARTGLSRPFLAKVERGESQVSTLGILAVARGLNVPPGWLFEVDSDVPEVHPWRR